MATSHAKKTDLNYIVHKMIILLPVSKAEKVFYYFANREGVLLERQKRKGVWLTLTVYFI